MEIITKFDYTPLSPEIRVSLKARAEKIGERNRRIASDIWENGRDLHEAQQELAIHGYGRFQEWVENETPYSLRNAYRFIDVYQQFDYAKLAQSNIATSALYLIAAASTPDEARQELIETAERGETVTYSQAKTAVDAARQETTDDFRLRLKQSLHSFQGAAERWERRREVGLTDKELVEAIAYEFGDSGGSSGPDLTSVGYKGGANPEFTYDTRDNPQTIKGAKLRDLVRELLEIPYPEDSAFPPRAAEPNATQWATVSELESLTRMWLAYATGGKELEVWRTQLYGIKSGGKQGAEFGDLMGWMDNDRATYRKGDLWQAVNNVHDQIRWQLAEREKEAWQEPTLAALEATAPPAPQFMADRARAYGSAERSTERSRRRLAERHAQDAAPLAAKIAVAQVEGDPRIERIQAVCEQITDLMHSIGPITGNIREHNHNYQIFLNLGHARQDLNRAIDNITNPTQDGVDPRYLETMNIRRQLILITAGSDEETEYDEETGSGFLAALRLADSFLKDACTALHPEVVPSVWDKEVVPSP